MLGSGDLTEEQGIGNLTSRLFDGLAGIVL